MTFGGECLSLAASIATIKELKTKDYSHIWKLGNVLEEGINQAAQEFGLKINFAGSAPRHNLTFSSEYENAEALKALFYQEMVAQNILFPNVIYIQFSHTMKDIQETVKASQVAFRKVAENIKNPEKAIKGKMPVSIFRKNT